MKWLEPTMDHLQPCHDNTSIKAAVKIQEQLGWRQFIRGKIAIQWGNIIRTHLQANKITSITAKNVEGKS
jgi:hypothetical protein